jgi:SAM-dependent methyltransferase
MHDKQNVLTKLDQYDPVVLELGCGNRKRIPGSIGIDMLDYPAVDIVGDLTTVLAAFPAAAVDRVTSHHVFEHLPDLAGTLEAVARVLKIGGRLEVITPHFSNPYYYSDATHRAFFGLYTFSYFAAHTPFRRRVPTYQRELHFDLLRVDLGFKSPPPFYVRYGVKRGLGALFNLNNYMREFYEENLCYLFPCYELRYELERIPSQPSPQ